MSNIEALKEKARRHEQKEEWNKALDEYLRAIDRLDQEEQPDIGLYNRVGDIMTRVGDADGAIKHFFRAMDLYLESELPNNAIAVCKKVIRHFPNRAEIFLKMGQIRASQGFLVDARDNFLTYAERKQRLGDTDEALRALVEFADLAPDDTEIRMSIANQYLAREQDDEAVAQLIEGYRALRAKGDGAGASAFEEKIHEIDPELDLSSLSTPAAPAFAFESTALGGEEHAGGDMGFGDIVVSDSDAGQSGPISAFEADDSEGIGEFEEISFGGEEEAGTVDVSGIGDDLPMAAFGESDDAEAGDEEEGEGEALPLLADFGDGEDVRESAEGEKAAQEATQSPDDGVVSADFDDISFGEEATDDADEEEGPPLPFLTDPGDDDGEVGAHEAGFQELDTSLSDTLQSAAEESAAAGGSPREEWEALRDRCRAVPSDADAPQHLVELAFKLDDQSALIESYLLLGSALREAGDQTRARSVFEQLLSIDPGNAEALAALGGSLEAGDGGSEEGANGGYVDLGALILGDDDEEKTTRFKVAYEEPSGDEDADFAKMLGQFKAKVAENFDASDVKAHHDLGTAYREMGLLDEAVEKFQQALRASPAHLPTYELLGQTFMEQGRHAAAVKVLQRALKVPSEVEDELIGIYYYLGRAFEGLGDASHAIEYYDRVFALDINFADVTGRLRELR